MPPMPPSPPGIAGAFSGLSATTASVVRNSAAIDAAFCSAERTTLVGSGMPAGSCAVLAGGGVQAVAGRETGDLLGHHAALEAGVDGDLPDRSGQRDLDDLGASGLVVGQVELLERRGTGLDQGHPTAGDDALLDRRLGGADGVLDAVLALLEPTSVAAPTLITATPPASLARRSCSFSRS